MSGAAAPGGRTGNGTEWDYVHTPRRMRTTVLVLAAVIILVHVVWAIILVRGDTGVTLGIADQLAFVVTGFIFAGVLLRAGKPGVEVTGPIRTRLWPWEDVVGLTFPRSSYWPRLELPAYEHVGIWAIQTFDGADGVDAMSGLREVVQAVRGRSRDRRRSLSRRGRSAHLPPGPRVRPHGAGGLPVP